LKARPALASFSPHRPRASTSAPKSSRPRRVLCSARLDSQPDQRQVDSNLTRIRVDARPMVKIRVTVTVLPEDVYLAAQDGHLNSAARSAQARKFMVSCESPETWTIGQFANKIKDAFSKTYRGEYVENFIPQHPHHI